MVVNLKVPGSVAHAFSSPKSSVKRDWEIVCSLTAGKSRSLIRVGDSAETCFPVQSCATPGPAAWYVIVRLQYQLYYQDLFCQGNPGRHAHPLFELQGIQLPEIQQISLFTQLKDLHVFRYEKCSGKPVDCCFFLPLILLILQIPFNHFLS